MSTLILFSWFCKMNLNSFLKLLNELFTFVLIRCRLNWVKKTSNRPPGGCGMTTGISTRNSGLLESFWLLFGYSKMWTLFEMVCLTLQAPLWWLTAIRGHYWNKYYTWLHYLGLPTYVWNKSHNRPPFSWAFSPRFIKLILFPDSPTACCLIRMPAIPSSWRKCTNVSLDCRVESGMLRRYRGPML